ncbi:kinase-like domain-containing protein [Aspergillus pseudodeflectus]|uniref:non-specific serine/threonine protein kinase n=1 Tax=Aspergillus pseudodeflectus TaxID=176178 RepID=A0ABR4KBP3_9EURO
MASSSSPTGGLTSPHLYVPIEDAEKLERYRSGGYHPVRIGDHLDNRYEIVQKLGYGSYSTIWLARDRTLNQFVAVKVYSFTVKGPNGTHSCYVITPAQMSFADAKDPSYHRLFTLEVARALSAQLAIAVHCLNSQGFVHGDLHDGNILIQLPSGFDYNHLAQPQLMPITRFDGKDLSSCIPSHATLPIWLEKASEDLALPEAKLLLSDHGQTFSPLEGNMFESRTPLHLILPPKWWNKWDSRRSKFNENGTPLNGRSYRSWEHRFEDCVQQPRRPERMLEFDPAERDAPFAMLRSMLFFRPECRPSAKDVLASEWMPLGKNAGQPRLAWFGLVPGSLIVVKYLVAAEMLSSYVLD